MRPGDRSALEYSRDAAAPVLQQIDCVFLSIRSGMFNPDGPRSDRWIERRGLREAIRMASSVASRVVLLGTLSVRDSHKAADLKETGSLADSGLCDSEVSSASSSASPDSSSDEADQEREAALGAKEVGRDLFDASDLESRVCFRHVETQKVHVPRASH